MRTPNSRHVAYALLRLAMGLNIAMHGLQRILAGVGEFVDATHQAQFADSWLPEALVRAFLGVLPWAELLVGLFIFVGLFSELALIVGMALMLPLIFGASAQAMWGAVGIQMIYMLLYYVLLRDVNANTWAADSLRKRRR